MATSNGQTATLRPPTGERTGRQVVSRPGQALTQGPRRLPASYDTYRQMRKHPTIALARALSIAPIVAAEWSVEADDDAPEGAADFIGAQFLDRREAIMDAALLGGIDFGHQPFEKVFDYVGGWIVLRKLKPLLQDTTEILVTEQGVFDGLKQAKVSLPASNCLLFSFRVEGTDWYGAPLLENARDTWQDWRECSAGAGRYDRKVAGVHWVVRFPNGESTDELGRLRANHEIARDFLATLESSGSIAIPDRLVAAVDALNIDQGQWQIQLVEDHGGRQPTFCERLRYLDSLLARSLLIPERSVLEGQYGTKAEAGEQIDLALTQADLQHRYVTRVVNWHAVDQLLALNFGESARGKVRLKAAPIRDAKLQYVKDVYTAFLANPSGFLEESGYLDTEAIRDMLGVPSRSEPESIGALPLPGVNADDPASAAVRRLYAEGVAVS
jgi:hypothetical protein